MVESCIINPFITCKDGKYVQSAMSVEHPDCPTLPGIKRIKVHVDTTINTTNDT